MKYSGAGGQSSRQEVEACEKKLGEVSAAQERVKMRHGRLTKVFVDIRAGIEHMSDKLEPVKLDQPAVPVSDDTVVDVMYQCDAKLLKMFNIVGDIDEQQSHPSPEMHSRGTTRASARLLDVHPAAEGSAPNYNVRVALEEVDDAYVDEDDEAELEGMEPVVIGREEMKKNAESMLDKATSKGKRKKKAGKFATETSPGKTSGGKAAGARPSMS